MQLPRPTSGSVLFEGRQLTEMDGDDMREARTRMQMIFQDPISSLNPRRKVRDIVMEPLTIWKRGTKAEQRRARSTRCSRRSASTRPRRREPAHQFSGGQCQRISIARSLVLDPTLIICDEPVSALDVSVQAQVLNLLEDLKAKHGLTLIFIAHDLAVVKNISDRVAVMYLGKICEVAAVRRPLPGAGAPLHAVLLNSIPVPDPDRRGDEDGDRGRAAITGAAAAGLPLPHPLPRRRRHLPQRRAATPRDRRGPLRCLPSPDSRRRRSRRRARSPSVSSARDSLN